MRAQLQQASGEIQPRNDDFQIDETVLDVHMKQAIARMLDWCARSPHVATFMARGFVVDSLSNISGQITDYFPRSINVMPIIDDLSFVVAQSARRTGQRYQEVALDYISDGKIPAAAQTNKQSFVKWYSVENVIGGDFDGHAKKLRPGWSGGAGSPTDMLKHLNLGTKKGFLLQVNALDIQDAKAQSLAADTGMMQAMGGSAAAMKEADIAVASGGVEAAKAQSVIEAVIEIKTIKAALTQAGDTPQAAPMAAALALKADALATTMGQIKLPPAMQAETARIVETVRIDMSARQITTALQTIVSNMPAIVTARPANDGVGPAGLASQVVKTVTALQVASQAANMPMRDAISLALTKQAPPALADAVKAVTTQLARKEALPVLDRLLPPAAAVTVRAMLTTPALKTVAQTPVAVAPVVAQIKALAAQMATPAQVKSPIPVPAAQVPVQAQVLAGAAKAAATPLTDAAAPKGATPVASVPASVATPASVVAAAGVAANATPVIPVSKSVEISAVTASVSTSPVLNVVSSAKGAFAQPSAAPVIAAPAAPVQIQAANNNNVVPVASPTAATPVTTTATPAAVTNTPPPSPSSAFVAVAPSQPAFIPTAVAPSAVTVSLASTGPALANTPVVVQPSAIQPTAVAAVPANNPVIVNNAPVQAAPPEIQRVEAPASANNNVSVPTQAAHLESGIANTNTATATQIEAQQGQKLRVIIETTEAQPTKVDAPASVQPADKPLAPQNMAEETVRMAAIVLNDTKNAAPPSGAEMAQAVADNLQALASNPAIPEATKSELTVLAAEAQAVGQQAKSGQYVPDIPQQPTLLNPQSPLAEITRATGVQTPTGVTEPTETVSRHMDMLRNDANIARQNMEMRASNDQGSPFSVKPTPKATEAEKAKAEVEKGCGDCKNGFNCATCGTQTPAEKKQTEATLSAAEKALQARNAELGFNRLAMS